MSRWRVLSSRIAFESRYVRVLQERVELGAGEEIDDFCRIESPPWAATVCITPSQELVLVRQYRHGLGEHTLELPAGGLESGETPLTAAKRELREETGYVASTWASLGALATDPSRQSTLGHFFLATGARKDCVPELDPGEELQVELHPVEGALRMIEDGTLCHGQHVAALLKAARRGWT